MSLIVFGSALGPVLFSLSFSKMGSYSFAIFGLAIVILIVALLSFKANNPQDKLESSQ